MPDSYRLRRELSDAIVTLRQVMGECQHRGFYDWYNVVRDSTQELEHILMMLELERARELAETQMRLNLGGHDSAV